MCTPTISRGLLGVDMCRVCYYCFEVSLTKSNECNDLAPYGGFHGEYPPVWGAGCRVWYTCGDCVKELRA